MKPKGIYETIYGKCIHYVRRLKSVKNCFSFVRIRPVKSSISNLLYCKIKTIRVGLDSLFIKLLNSPEDLTPL